MLKNRHFSGIDDEIATPLVTQLSWTNNLLISKVALTGHSIGGTGAYQLQIKLPNTFACIAPMSGFVKNSDEKIKE